MSAQATLPIEVETVRFAHGGGLLAPLRAALDGISGQDMLHLLKWSEANDPLPGDDITRI